MTADEMTAASSNERAWTVRILIVLGAACGALTLASPAAALGEVPIVTPPPLPTPPVAAPVTVSPPPVPDPATAPAPPPPAAPVAAPAVPQPPAPTPPPAPQVSAPAVAAPVVAPALPTRPPAPKVSAPAVAAPVVAPALPVVPVSAEQPTLPKLPPTPAIAAPSVPLEQVAVAPATQAVAELADAGAVLLGSTVRTAAAAVVQVDEPLAAAGAGVARVAGPAPQRSSGNDVVPASSAGQPSSAAQPAPEAAVSANAPAAAATGELSTASADAAAPPQRLGAAPERPVAFAPVGRGSTPLSLTTFDSASIEPLPRLAGVPAESTASAGPTARPSRELPPRPSGAAVTSSTAAGGAAAALLLLMCLTSFLLAAPPLRRWLRRQHGLALPSVLLAPLENPG